MQTRNLCQPSTCARRRASLLAALLALAGCGVPGDPQPRRPLVPREVTDLAARQAGPRAVLTFTLPEASADGRPLPAPPDVEIFRAFLPARATPQAKDLPSKPLLTIPSTLVDTYRREDNQILFADLLTGELLERYAGQQAVYMVRTRATSKRASADSNLAAVRIFPAPEPSTQLAASVTELAIELTWIPPVRTVGGTRLDSVAGYRVYRAEIVPGETGEPEFRLLGPATAARYRDTQFEFGRSYRYAVTSVAQHDAESVESELSAPVVVTPRDVFPPAPPGNVVIAVVPAQASQPAYVELSWGLGTEPDLAGYHVYRSDREELRGERLNPDLLLMPAFRDISVQPGRRYFYTVTAVDRAGNESLASSVVSEAVP